jgi:hypothetical protein
MVEQLAAVFAFCAVVAPPDYIAEEAFDEMGFLKSDVCTS